MTDFKTIPLSEIHPDKNQPRKFYDATAMEELTQSIKEKGVLQPILIRPNGTGYLLVCGERRFKAATSAGLTDIPAVIRSLTDDEALELQIIENLQRKDIHPMEEAFAFASLIEHRQMNEEEVAARIGKKVFYVRQRLKLNSLTPEWQKLFFNSRLTLVDALKICVFEKKQQKELFDEEGDSSTIELSNWTLAKYKGELEKAAFDTTDPTLQPKMGACTNCKFNSAVSLLFPEHSISPKCSNLTCFQNKTDVHYTREMAKAKEDPTVILISDEYNVNSMSKAANALRKEGLEVLTKSNYSNTFAPDKPDYEDWLEDEGDDYKNDEERMEAFNKELQEYEQDQEKYQQKIATAKFQKAFLVDGDTKGRYVYVSVTKSKSSSNKNAAQETISTASIDEEIAGIKQRTKRAAELDDEKVYAQISDLLKNSKEFTSNKRDARLTREEITAAVVALHEAGSTDFRKLVKKRLSLNVSDYYRMTTGDVEKLTSSGLTELGVNELMWHFILDKILLQNGASHKTSGKALAIYNITKHYHGDEVNKAEIEQKEKRAKREARAAQRIKALQEQKKETVIKKDSKPAPAKSVEKGSKKK